MKSNTRYFEKRYKVKMLNSTEDISLARLFLMNKAIVILEEPTSALDKKSKEIICHNKRR
ncbi:hypothetical protein [Abyssisolibacter fermentans]|uniref:hypothetical protein n=1 Tax=Abyssisolibacter fermentans TaxID=1766203 RepID=UPI0012E35E04|nr:hypothetical protein [Abyssisolibacter fermentans]